MAKKVFCIKIAICLVAIFCLSFINSAFAWKDFEHNSYVITNFEIMEDPHGEYRFDMISSLAFSDQFKPYFQDVISLGITKSVYWIRFQSPSKEISARDTCQLLQLNNPNIDKIDVFIPVADNSSDSGVRYDVKSVGVSRPSGNRDIKDNTWVFSIPNQFMPNQFLYLRLESSSALRIPVIWWQNSLFINDAFLKNLGYGAFYGILLAMFLYNFFIFFYNFWANQIAHGLGITGPLVIMALALIRLRQGFRPARYYLLAWGILSIGIVIWVMAAYIPDTFKAVNFLLVATASESILLSFALSDRFKTLRLKQAILKKNVQYYQNLSLIDESTNLYNKRYLKEKLREEIAVALQAGNPLAILVIDIDHFKNYNDCYGHWEGDQVLVRLGEVILSVLDSSQLAFRYGGEEFVILMPNIRSDGACNIAENIRQRIQMEEFTPGVAKTAQVTVSIGLTELKRKDSPGTLFKRADDALYQAKAAGRNQIVWL